MHGKKATELETDDFEEEDLDENNEETKDA